MPKFSIYASRDYVVRESLQLVVTADTADDAIQEAMRMQRDDELEDEWSEDDGGPDNASLTWAVVDADGKKLAEAMGNGE